MFLFKYTRPGSAEAWYLGDSIINYRWIGSGDKINLQNAGVPTIAVPSYISTMNLMGPVPP